MVVEEAREIPRHTIEGERCVNKLEFGCPNIYLFD
jgi:hypothetical protein